MSRFQLTIKFGVVGLTLLLSACATTGQNDAVNDPLEGYNRAMYKFNSVVDKALLKPVATGYDTVVPTPISEGISNFFNNLNDVVVVLNDVLQLKFNQAYRDTGRFLLNSTVGVAGILDVATMAGLKKNDEDFGQTLGSWGFGSGAYVVLPILGPSSVRDTFGVVGDIYTHPITYMEGPGARNALWGTLTIDKRATLLSVGKVVNQAALDEYSYVRDAYLQHRQYLVYDGNPPEENFDDFDVFSK